jgi:hypothetical protein
MSLVLLLVLQLVLLLVVQLWNRREAAAGEAGIRVSMLSKAQHTHQTARPQHCSTFAMKYTSCAEVLQVLLLLPLLLPHTWAAWPWGQVMQWGTHPVSLLLPFLTAARRQRTREASVMLCHTKIPALTR